jgi:uncharacterized membrane protein
MTRVILALHVVAGSIALSSMFVPIVAKKGGMLHRRAGWVFVSGMAIVSATAMMLSLVRLLTDATPRGQFAGWFLLFVAVLTGAGVSAGVRVLRAKGRTTAHRHLWDLGVASTLTAASLAAAAYGLSTSQHLCTGLFVVGLLKGGGQLAYWLRPPTHPMHWWFEHMGAMLGSCIAATTAFLVVNGASFGVGRFSLVVWFGPTIIGVPVIAVWTAYYRRTFAATTRRQAASGLPHAAS